MEIVLDVLILAVALFIAVEILLLRIDQAKAKKPVATVGEEHQGQVINVNLGLPTSGSRASSPRSSIKKAEPPIGEVVPSLKEEAPVAPAPESRPRALANSSYVSPSAKSSPAVIVCAKCKAENTSFRSECFNCGAELR